MVGTLASFAGLFATPGSVPWYLAPPFWATYPVLWIGVMIMHGFCWYVGLMYRKHHLAFGWAFQRHEKVDRLPPLPPKRSLPLQPQFETSGARRARMHAQQPPPAPPAPPATPVPQRVLPIPPHES
jgi:hypothetical protein